MITVPKLNMRQLNRAVKHIQKFPETYYQNDITKRCEIEPSTPCGAIGCLGGWLVLLKYPIQKRQQIAGQGGTWKNTAGYGVQLLGPEPTTAQSIAGLTEPEGLYLFSGSSTDDPRQNLKLIKKRIVQIQAARNKIVELNRFLEKLPLIETTGQFEFKTKDGKTLRYNV